MTLASPLIVLDTMIVVGAIIGKATSADSALVRAVETGEVRLALSDEGLLELTRVLEYPAIESKVRRPVRAFRVALALAQMGKLYRAPKLDWPSLPDPGDAWLFDLAFAANADYIVTRDTRHVHATAEKLGFSALSPRELLARLHG